MYPQVLVTVAGLLALVTLTTSAAGVEPQHNTIYFLKEGRMVLRPALGKVTLNASLAPLFEVYDLLHDRIQSLTSQRLDSFEKDLRELTIISLEDHMTRAWRLLQEDLRQGLPVDDTNEFDGLLDAIRDQEQEREETMTSNLPVDRTMASQSTTSTSTSRPTTSTSTSRPTTSKIATNTSRSRSRRTLHGLSNMESRVVLEPGALRPIGVCNALKKLIDRDDRRLEGINTTHLQLAIIGLDKDINTLIEVFTRETESLARSLEQLLRGEFPVSLIRTADLMRGFEQATRQAKELGWSPVVQGFEDWLQVPQPSFRYEGEHLELDLRVPFSQGMPAKLYEFRATPWATNGFVVKVRPEKKYMAWDTELRLAAELTEEDLKQCPNWEGLHWCPSPPTVERTPSELCLYNLFQQRVAELERTCPLVAETGRTEAIRVMPNVYHLYTQEPTTLVQECAGQAEPTVTHLPPHFVLKLNRSCPRAYTSTQVYNLEETEATGKQLAGQAFSKQMSKWLEELVSPPESMLAGKMLQQHEEENEHPLSLKHLKKAIRQYVLTQMKEALVYVTFTILPMILLGALTICLRRCASRWRKRPRTRDAPPGVTNRLPFRLIATPANRIIELNHQ